MAGDDSRAVTPAMGGPMIFTKSGGQDVEVGDVFVEVTEKTHWGDSAVTAACDAIFSGGAFKRR